MRSMHGCFQRGGPGQGSRASADQVKRKDQWWYRQSYGNWEAADLTLTAFERIMRKRADERTFVKLRVAATFLREDSFYASIMHPMLLHAQASRPEQSGHLCGCVSV